MSTLVLWLLVGAANIPTAAPRRAEKRPNPNKSGEPEALVKSDPATPSWLHLPKGQSPVKFGSHVLPSELESWINRARPKCSRFQYNMDSAKAGRYELADIFHGHGRGREEREAMHRDNFPGSIASAYLVRKKGDNDFKILAQIVENRLAAKARAGENVRRVNATVFHLRLGDVVEEDPRSVMEMLAGDWWGGYVKPLSYYEGTRLPRLPETIVLVSGSHVAPPQGGNSSKSCIYMEVLASYWRSRGWRVRLRTGFSPDEDFLFMSRAKYFVRSGGRLTNLIGWVVESRGGNLLPRPNDAGLFGPMGEHLKS